MNWENFHFEVKKLKKYSSISTESTNQGLIAACLVKKKVALLLFVTLAQGTPTFPHKMENGWLLVPLSVPTLFSREG